MSSQDQETLSARVVSLMSGAAGEGFLGHLVVGSPRPPPRTGKIQKPTKVQGGSPRLRRGRTTSWRLGWGPEFGKRGAMKETRGWERLMQRGGGTELQPTADETRGLRDAFGLPGLERCSSGRVWKSSRLQGCLVEKSRDAKGCRLICQFPLE